MRRLVLNADDYALTPGVSRGILRAGRDGALTSTSVLANGRAFEAWAPRLRQSGLHVGVHLALAGGDPPVLPASHLPSLARRGVLPADWRAFAWRFATRLIDPTEVRAELAAQIARVESIGVPISHLDGHQYLHLLPGIREIVVELARDRGIGVIGIPRAHGGRRSGVLLEPLARAAAAHAAAAGLATPEDAAGFDEAGRLDGERLGLAVDALGARGAASAVVNLHPGEREDRARDLYPWGYRWGDELEALCDPGLARRIERAGFALAGYADLGLPGSARVEAR